MNEVLAANLAHWEQLAAVHGNGTDTMYDVPALIAGKPMMTAAELAAVESVGGVRDRDVMHLQCHIGFDAIWFAQQGARVTGVDFSPAALAKAESIAARAGVSVRWVQSDAQRLPDSLAESFDIVYASIGAICWIEDLQAWMDGAARCLRPGGHLVLVDIHPLFGMIDTFEPLVADCSYAYAGPEEWVGDGSYADHSAPVIASRTLSFAHDLGEIVTCAVKAGLNVRELREVQEMHYFPRGGDAVPDPDGMYRIRIGGQTVPMLFSLTASKG